MTAERHAARPRSGVLTPPARPGVPCPFFHPSFIFFTKNIFKMQLQAFPSKPAGKLPATFKAFIKKFPKLGEAHELVARGVEEAGPLDAKQCALIKIGICVGAGLQSALRSHVRRAMQHGATTQEIEQAVLLGMNTVGFPRTVAAWSWARQQIERGP